MAKKISVAVIQSAPVLFDLQGTLSKVAELMQKARGAELMLFPEAFVSVYPRGLSFGTVVGGRSGAGRQLWQRYWDASIAEGDEAFLRLGELAKKYQTLLAIGVNEKDLVSGTMYCSLFYFGPAGEFLGKHRKIKPTAQERVIWGEGDASTLTTLNTAYGRVGGLICWENYMPLARMAMYQKGVQIYLAPTADARLTWQSTMQHIALEGRCFVLAANQWVTRDMYPKDLQATEDLSKQPETMSAGGSVIVNPLGEVLAGPVWNQEAILTADINMEQITQSKLDFDPIGHYHRPDVFELNITGQPPIKQVL